MVEGLIKICGSLFIGGIGLGLIAGSLIIIVVTLQSIKKRFLD
jgi:hypothetical protein|tara:strand:+ start:6018 stop:6146 length:129 start_codon:yes stop_codon:yes gene_type:complete